MDKKTMSPAEVESLIKGIAFEMDGDVFLARIQQAVDDGLDLSSPVPMGRSISPQSVIDSLINIADEGPRREIIRRYCDPMDGMLHESMKKDSSVAYAILQVAIENNRPGPTGESVFEHLLQAPMSRITPGLLYSAYIAGTNSTPPPDTNWFQVFTQSPHAFPDEKSSNFVDGDWQCGWGVISALLDMGFDPCQPESAANQTMEGFRGLLAVKDMQIPQEARGRIQSRIEAFELESASSFTPAAPSRMRL